MSLRPSRLALALGAAALATAATAATATAAHAAPVAAGSPGGQFRLVYDHTYRDANALSECETTGSAGQLNGSWDYYKCLVASPTDVELQGWLNVT